MCRAFQYHSTGAPNYGGVTKSALKAAAAKLAEISGPKVLKLRVMPEMHSVWHRGHMFLPRNPLLIWVGAIWLLQAPMEMKKLNNASPAFDP